MGNQPATGALCPPLQCPKTLWTREHCCCCTVNPRTRLGEAPHPAAAWKKRSGDKISRSFYYWDFIFKSNVKYITDGKTPEVWASLWDSSMPLLCSGYPAHPRKDVRWKLAVRTISMAARTMWGLILPPGMHQGGAVAHEGAGTAGSCQEASHGHRVP